MRGALGIVRTLLYLQTQNLWLALVAHWGMSWGLISLARTLPLPPAGETDQIAV
jgi:membrane protease YdiL (CAAX protease family)